MFFAKLWDNQLICKLNLAVKVWQCFYMDYLKAITI